jgi:hypothetical protein
MATGFVPTLEEEVVLAAKSECKGDALNTWLPRTRFVMAAERARAVQQLLEGMGATVRPREVKAWTSLYAGTLNR